MEAIFLDTLRTHHTISDRDRGYSITVMDMRGKTLIQPLLKYRPRGQVQPVTLQMDEARLQFDLEHQQVILHLVNTHFESAEFGGFMARPERIPFPFPQNLSTTKPRHMSIGGIENLRADTDRKIASTGCQHDIETAMALTLGDFDWLAGYESQAYQTQVEIGRHDLAKMNTEIHSRYAMSASCFFFVLLGAPYAVSQARQQFLTSFFLCFMPILLLYYPLAMLMMNLSKTSTVDPAWAMWVSNGLLLIAGLVVLRKVLKH
jgi:lipopolysaccharide export system permease protein